MEAHPDTAALCKVLYIPFSGRRQAGVFNDGWVQQVRKSAHLVNTMLEQLVALVPELGVVRKMPCQIQVHFQTSKVLADGLMEFACHPAALDVLQLQKLKGEFAQSSGALLDNGFEFDLICAQARFGVLSGLDFLGKGLGPLLEFGDFTSLVLFDNSRDEAFCRDYRGMVRTDLSETFDVIRTRKVRKRIGAK